MILHMHCEQIGSVRSPVKEGIDKNWGSIVSEIVIDERYSAGLRGLSEFSHVMVVFHMHRSSFDPVTDLVRRPQGREDLPLVGIFAQRAKHRPNPIGVTAAELVSVEGNVVRVRGLDAIDGTPVIDLKPYFIAYDRRDARTPPWVDELMRDYFSGNPQNDSRLP
jgi:tRNA-Thr(GGU) m(6)t(6)A37 methyltransferase TsaA